MAFQARESIQRLCVAGLLIGLFLCFFTAFPADKKTFAYDKKTSSAISHYIMGVLYEDLGDIDKAISEYEQSIKADSGNSAAHLNLASSYVKKNNLPQAIEELRLAASFDPEAVEPHAILALLYSAQDKPDLAAKEYEIALNNASKLQPKNVDIYKSLAMVYIQQGKFKEAQGAYLMAVNLAPDDAEAHFYLGSVYYELKDNLAAEKEIKKALELRPDYHEALNFLGYSYLQENRNIDEAGSLIKKAIVFDPVNGAYIDSLGWYYFKKGDIREAVEKLEKASTMIEDPEVYDHLGEVYFKLNDSAKAKLNWEKSLKLKPGQDKIKEKLQKIK